MSDWQPIETAPKDGTWIVLLIPESCHDSDRPKTWIEAAKWIEEYQGVWEQVSRDRKDLVEQDLSHWSCYEDPTHWMPLPKEPL